MSWVPVTVALVHTGGVSLVTARFWMLAASLPAASCITLSPVAGRGWLTDTVSPLATGRFSVSVTVLFTASTLTLLTPMGVVVPALVTAKALAGGGWTASRPEGVVWLGTSWVPVTVAVRISGGVSLVATWLLKLVASLPAVSCIARVSSPGAESLELNFTCWPDATALVSVKGGVRPFTTGLPVTLILVPLASTDLSSAVTTKRSASGALAALVSRFSL